MQLPGEGRQRRDRATGAIIQWQPDGPQEISQYGRREVLVPHVQRPLGPRGADSHEKRCRSLLQELERTEPSPIEVKAGA